MTRAQPWLGTRVVISAVADDADRVQAAITAAFCRVAEVHRRLSFHAPDSELSRLHRDAWRAPVAVHADTRDVLRLALAVAARSDGAFDPTVAPVLVEAGYLPEPRGARRPDPRSDWRDVVIGADDTIAFRKPLWLDLGGCAKGYAVDAAVAVLRKAGVAHGCVEAGGDLRVFGSRSKRVRLRDFVRPDGQVAVVELHDAALAGSASLGTDEHSGTYVDARRRKFSTMRRAAAVTAPSCAVADALTKVVLAGSPSAAPLLAGHGARAFVLDLADTVGGWRGGACGIPSVIAGVARSRRGSPRALWSSRGRSNPPARGG